MNLGKSLLATAFIVFASASNAATTVIKFDAVIGHPNGVAPPNGYYGDTWLGWTNFHLIEVTNPDWSNSGAVNASVSLPGVANTDPGPAQIQALGPFTLNSAYFAADWNDGLEVTVRGQSNGLIIHTKSFEIDTKHPTLVTFNWDNVDNLLFTATGGTPNSALSGGTGTGFAMDNLIITSVPEPETYAMFLAGLSLLGWRMRSART